MKVAIVGASGAVGQEFLTQCRTKIHFPRERDRSKTPSAQR